MSTLAVFIALGGSSYAAVHDQRKDIKNRSIPGKKLKRNSITGPRESASRVWNGAASARGPTKLGGFTPKELQDSLPEGHVPDR